MSSYRGTADRPDRAKAIAGVAAVHVALAFVILSGLNVSMVRQAVEQMTTIAIREPPPPPPVQPPPKPAVKPQAMKKPQGAAAKKAEPSPVVAPQPKLPVPSPIPAAKVAGRGSATTSGAGASGNGTGAGGAGAGPGGGGLGSIPARQIAGIPNREYRRLSAGGLRSGRVGVTVRINTDGSVSNCRVAASSGNGYADSTMCVLVVEYVRFIPRHDSYGRPVAEEVTFYPSWWRP